MAKKAAALQSFQKCDVGNLAIPSTIVEDTEMRQEPADNNFGVSFDQDDSGSERQKFVVVESDTERHMRELREPSDRIEIAVSPVR